MVTGKLKPKAMLCEALPACGDVLVMSDSKHHITEGKRGTEAKAYPPLSPILLGARPLTMLTIAVHVRPMLQCNQLPLNMEHCLRRAPCLRGVIPHPHQLRDVLRKGDCRRIANALPREAEQLSISELEECLRAGCRGGECRWSPVGCCRR
jgi:hypothetical protein